MNKACYRLVFNAARGQVMVAPENARGGTSGGDCSRAIAGQSWPAFRAKLMPMALALACAWPASSHATLFGNLAAALGQGPAAPGAARTATSGATSFPVRADPSAPANQRPTILLAPNGVPLVNIQTPSPAGVSRNSYSDFNVGSNGLILNNSVKNTPTQLGGWVQGNPWLARGPARVILNEVNSSNPSLLYGAMEVAGPGASVIVANPSGITCNGCGFINTPRVTLTTGTAILDANDGSVRGYRVQQGQVLIDGAGMNNQQVDFTDIVTRALKINAAIWAQDVRVVAGAREVGSDDSGLQPGALLADKDRPQVAIDLSVLGGIYARGIRMIGTQSGVGVSSAGKMYAGVGEVLLTSDGRIVNKGSISGAGDVTLQASSMDNSGAVLANGTLAVQTSGDVSNPGTLAAGGAVAINGGGKIASSGLIGSDGALRLKAAAVENSGLIMGQDVGVSADRLLNANTLTADNSLGIQATGKASVNAVEIDNAQGNLLSAGELTVRSTGNLNNAGGQIAAGGMLDIADPQAQPTLAVNNKHGSLFGAKGLQLQADQVSGEGDILSAEDLNLTVRQDFINQGRVLANANATVQSAGQLRNESLLLAGNALSLQAASVDNQQAGEIRAAQVTVQAQDHLTNRGLIDGGATRVEARTLDNLGTGRIYGDLLAIAADTVNNIAENGTAPIIAARQRLDLAARLFNNREHAQMLSLGDMAIGRTLDAQGHAIGRADTLTNASATLQAAGRLDIKAASLVNTNLRFSIEDVELPLEQVTEYQASGSPLRFAPGSPDVYVYNDESDHLHTPEGNFESWNLYQYTRRTSESRVASSDPGKIISGGDMQIDAGSVLNDRSQIIAGGNLAVNAGTLTNTEVTGLRRIVESGIVTNYWRDHKKGRDSTGATEYDYLPPERIEAITLTPTVFKQNTTTAPTSTPPARPAADNTPMTEVAQSGTVVRSGGVRTRLPDSAVYRIQPDPSAGYLVETDPAFANYRQWLGSDYLLRGMSNDPNAVQKRLGDGYYEQRLIQEQVAQLTGRRFLDDYSSDEEQYRALMDQGLTFAKAQQLKPGIALSDAQMAQLTSDIVWLVEKEITLPDGSVTRALVPQLYVRAQPGDLQSGGALMAGENVQMNVAGDLNNAGTIAGRKVVALTTENLRNIGGNIHGDAVGLVARQDIDNIGGSIKAESTLLANAGRDVNVTSNTRTQSNAQGSVTNVERVAGLYVSSDKGTLAVSAGRDINLTAAAVTNAGDTTTLSAGRDLNLNTVTESRSQNLAWDSKNTRSDSTQSEVGSVIQSKGDVMLQAGRDLTARAAQVQSSDGALTLAAGNDINISAGQTRQQVDEAHEHKGTSGVLSSTTYKSRDVLDATSAQASNLSGKTVTVVAGRNASVTGSNVISDAGTVIAANGNVSITAAQETRNETHFREEKTSGVTSSGGVGVSIGTQKQTLTSNTLSTSAAASTVGSVQGDVTIAAGQNYQQTGSDVLAPQGNIAIAAKNARIEEARETSRTTEERKFEQTGVTVAVSNPVITAIQTAEQMKQAASNTSDTRMKALAAANVAMVGKTAVNKVKAGQGETVDGNPNQIQTGKTTADGKAETRDARLDERLGGIDVSVSVGKTTSQSKVLIQSDQGRGSTLAAGKDVQISASGDGANSNLVVQGSTLRAGGSATLQADNAVQLLASQNTASQQSSSKDSSASVGLSFGTKGLTANATVSSARGAADGNDVSYSNTRVEAGDSVNIKSGGDTVLRGAVLSAPRVNAEVGGSLQIESLQDTSHYKSSQQSLGGSVSVGAGSVSGSISASKTKVDSDYAAVAEQSGIQAGDGGFDVSVKGTSTLTGGAITSTQKAVEEGKNRYQADGGTTLTDIKNAASYSASGTGVNLGTGFDPQGKLAPSGTSIGVGSDGDQKQSTTRAAISDIAGDKDARTGNAPAALPKIFDATRVQKEITAQVLITRTFGQEASKAVAGYAKEKREQLRTLYKQAPTEADRGAIQEQIKQLNMEERAMNVLIGAVQGAGLGTTAAAKEALSTAADAMRQLMIEDSMKFKGVTDGKTVLSNMSGESAGVRGDGTKVGGTRIDLDLLCGRDNSRCQAHPDGSLALNERGQVVFRPEGAGGKSLAEFLSDTPEGRKMSGLTGGVQGAKGTLFGIPYEANSWVDNLVESFSGTHDMVGGKLSGLYDEQGNATRGRSKIESKVQDAWSASGAIVVSSPFAMAEFLSPEMWKAISVLIGAVK